MFNGKNIEVSNNQPAKTLIQKYGLTKDDIICEDLGEVTPPVANVMKKLNLYITKQIVFLDLQILHLS